MFKNPTPKQLAFYTALITALVVFLLVIAINITPSDMDRAMNIVFLPVLTFIACFFAARYLINEFIYRRIKVIYKKISEAKKSDEQPMLGAIHSKMSKMKLKTGLTIKIKRLQPLKNSKNIAATTSVMSAMN